MDPDASERAKCAECGKWMLVRAGNPCCPECTKTHGSKVRPKRPVMVVTQAGSDIDPHDEMQCSYCGAYVYLDAARCPKCGEYTDGLGKYKQLEQSEGSPRRLSTIFLVGGWLVLIAMLLPIILAMYYYFLKR